MKQTASEIATPSVARGNTYGEWLDRWCQDDTRLPPLRPARCKACHNVICDHKDAVYQGVVPAEGV